MHVLSFTDFEGMLEELFETAERLKREPLGEALRNRTLAMIFEKASTRTRVSFEVAMTQLGGHAIYLSPKEMQMGRGESIADTARTLSRYVDAVLIRAKRREDVVEFARHSEVPVINGLTELEHPCQALSDFFTMRELRGELEGARLAYVGDGNNVCHSLMLGSAMLGMHFSCATPEGYEPRKEVLERALMLLDQAVDIYDENGRPLSAAYARVAAAEGRVKLARFHLGDGGEVARPDGWGEPSKPPRPEEAPKLLERAGALLQEARRVLVALDDAAQNETLGARMDRLEEQCKELGSTVRSEPARV